MSEQRKTLGLIAHAALVGQPYHTPEAMDAAWEHIGQAVKAAVLAEYERMWEHPSAYTQKMAEHGVRECREALADLHRALVYFEAYASGLPAEATEAMAEAGMAAQKPAQAAESATAPTVEDRMRWAMDAPIVAALARVEDVSNQTLNAIHVAIEHAVLAAFAVHDQENW